MGRYVDELRKLRRHRARRRWISRWSIDMRIGHPPGRIWAAIAALAMAGMVCSPAIALFFATQVLDPPLWFTITAALLVVALPFTWRVAFRDRPVIYEAGDDDGGGRDDSAA